MSTIESGFKLESHIIKLRWILVLYISNLCCHLSLTTVINYGALLAALQRCGRKYSWYFGWTHLCSNWCLFFWWCTYSTIWIPHHSSRFWDGKHLKAILLFSPLHSLQLYSFGYKICTFAYSTGCFKSKPHTRSCFGSWCWTCRE